MDVGRRIRPYAMGVGVKVGGGLALGAGIGYAASGFRPVGAWEGIKGSVAAGPIYGLGGAMVGAGLGAIAFAGLPMVSNRMARAASGFVERTLARFTGSKLGAGVSKYAGSALQKSFGVPFAELPGLAREAVMHGGGPGAFVGAGAGALAGAGVFGLYGEIKGAYAGGRSVRGRYGA